MTVSQATDGATRHRIGHGTGSPGSIVPHLSGHIPALDGVRGLAILLVLVYHFTLGVSGKSLATKLLLRMTSAGWCGVDLFFVLSGFLITGILFDAKESPHRFRNFYARRALRIFPLYYGTLIAVFGGLPWIASWTRGFDGVEDAGVWLWAYGTNILVALRGGWFPLSHFWSLAVEEHFYLIWPALIFYSDRKTSMRICAAVVAIALATRVWLVMEGACLAAYCLTICRMDALAMGGLVALAIRGPGGRDAITPLARKVALISSVALLALTVGRSGLFFHDPAVQTVGYALLDLFFASTLALVVSSPGRFPLSTLFDLAPLRSLGRYSYGLYVYNSIAILILEGISSGPTALVGIGRFRHLFWLMAAIVMTFAAAWLSWHLFEKQFLRFKRFYDEPSGDRAGRNLGTAAGRAAGGPGVLSTGAVGRGTPPHRTPVSRPSSAAIRPEAIRPSAESGRARTTSR